MLSPGWRAAFPVKKERPGERPVERPGERPVERAKELPSSVNVILSDFIRSSRAAGSGGKFGPGSPGGTTQESPEGGQRRAAACSNSGTSSVGVFTDSAAAALAYPGFSAHRRDRFLCVFSQDPAGRCQFGRNGFAGRSPNSPAGGPDGSGGRQSDSGPRPSPRGAGAPFDRWDRAAAGDAADFPAFRRLERHSSSVLMGTVDLHAAAPTRRPIIEFPSAASLLPPPSDCCCAVAASPAAPPQDDYEQPAGRAPGAAGRAPGAAGQTAGPAGQTAGPGGRAPGPLSAERDPKRFADQDRRRRAIAMLQSACSAAIALLTALAAVGGGGWACLLACALSVGLLSSQVALLRRGRA